MKSSAGKVTASRVAPRPLSPGMRAAKAVFWWLVLPAAIAFIGYRYVGPSIGKVPEIKKGAEKILATGRPEASALDEPSAVSNGSKPTIDISVEKGAKVEKPAEQRPRRSTKKKKPKPVEPSPTDDGAPKADPASGDGATAPPDADPASGGGGEGTGGVEGLSSRPPVA